MTAHERLTAPGAAIHLPRCRARARKADVRSGYGHDPREARLQSPLRTSTSAETGVRARTTRPTAPIQRPQKAICRPLKSHR